MQQLQIGDIVRVTQLMYARLYSKWYTAQEQRIITNAVGRRAQVRSIHEYNGKVRYRLRIEGTRTLTKYGFELSELTYESTPPEPFPPQRFAIGERVVAPKITDDQPREVLRVTYFDEYNDILYQLDGSMRYYPRKELTSINATTLNYTLF